MPGNFSKANLNSFSHFKLPFLCPLPNKIDNSSGHDSTKIIFILTNLFFFSLPCCMAYGILVPQSGIKPVPPALEAQSLNHWTAREVPTNLYFTLLSRSCLDNRWPFPPHQYSLCFFSFILPPLLSQSPKPEMSQQCPHHLAVPSPIGVTPH